MRRIYWVLGLAACAAPEEAPESLQEATEAVLRDFEDDEVVDTRAQDFVDFVLADLEAVEADGEDYLGLGLETVPVEDVSDMFISDNVDWEKVVGAFLARRVEGDLDAYAAIVPESDQSFADPATYNLWEREITEGSATSFRDGEPLRTWNEIEKSGAFGVVIPYPMQKDYRWVELEQGRALLFRSWAADEGWGEDGVNGLVSGWTIEVWLEDGDQTMWANASWTELALIVDDIDPDWLANEFIKGCNDYFSGTEDYVNGTATR